MKKTIDWHKVYYWRGVRAGLAIFAPWVASGACLAYASREIFGNAFLAVWGLFAFGMVVAWLYGLWVTRFVPDDNQ